MSLLLVIVVYSVQDVLLSVLEYLPHGPAHHMTGCIRCYSQSVALPFQGYILRVLQLDYLLYSTAGHE